MEKATNEQLMDFMIDHVRRTYDGGEFVPMWTLMDEEGAIYIVATPFNGDEIKDAVAGYIRKLIKEKNIFRVGFISEAWVISSKDDPKITKDTVPSEHPKRKEVFLFSVEDKYGKCLTSAIEIHRNDEKAWLDDDNKIMPGQMSGRFAGLFEHVKVSAN